jgi:hypothetical protein
LLAIPREERWTGTAPPVDFDEVLLLVAGNFDFVLQHAGGPEHAHYVRFFGLAKSDDDLR